MAFDRDQVLPLLDQGFRRMVPHNAELRLEVVDCGEGVAVLRLPWDERLIGNPETRVLAGGAVTTLIDACCGASVFLKLQSPAPIATLDLRIDYLKPATPDRAVIARAECYRRTHSVAFVRAVAYHETVDDPIASAAATFMLSTKGKSVMQRMKGE